MAIGALLMLPLFVVSAIQMVHVMFLNPDIAAVPRDASLFTVEAILVILIVSDWRAGQRRLAYPLSLAFFILLHAAMVPVAASATWTSLMASFNGLPIFW